MRPHASINSLTSPASASSLGKLEASAVVLSLMDDNGDALSVSNGVSCNPVEKKPTQRRSRVQSSNKKGQLHIKTETPTSNGAAFSKNLMMCIPKAQVPLSYSSNLKIVQDARISSSAGTVNNKAGESSSSDESATLANLKRKISRKKLCSLPASVPKSRAISDVQTPPRYSNRKRPNDKTPNVKEPDCPEEESKLQDQTKRRSLRLSSRLKSKSSSITNEDVDEGHVDASSDEEFNGRLSETSSEDSDTDSEIYLPSQKSANKPKNVAPKKVNGKGRRNHVTPSKIRTPKSKLPFIPARQTPVRTAKNGLEKSRECLHVSAIPQCLPCRENEFQEVYNFVESKVRSGGGGCMYVSGVPGTGKTATIQDVMNCLRQSADNGEMPNFTFVDINGMRLTEPRQAYVQILWQMNKQKATADHAANMLTTMFSQRRKTATVVIADELDLLWTKKQDVLYHLFDWPTHRHAKLIVVAIANTMDLPERVMMNRVTSRLGLTRLTFRPYNFKQLQEIVSSRLEDLDTFESDAIQLASRKVAAVSGDARRCLDICRRATEIAERSLKQVVGIEQVHEALQEMFATPMIKAIRGCSVQEKLFLRAITAEFQRSGMEEATLGMIIHHHATICQLEGASPVSVSTLIQISHRLATNRLILLEGGHKDLFSRIRLNVSVDDVLFSLNE